MAENNNSKKYISPSRLGDFLNKLKDKFAPLSHSHKLSDITDYEVDTALSATSTNPVQNKAIDAEFDAIATAMNALESSVDTSIQNITSGTVTVKEAEHATSADTATTAANANHATTADTATSADSVAWGNVTNKPSTFAPSAHTHDDRYYTETEIDGFLSNVAEKDHSHSNYALKATTINGKALSSNITLSASDVGALPDTTSIPTKLSDLTADATHRTVTDAEKATWDAKSEFDGNYNSLTNKPTIPSIDGLATETYVDTALNDYVEKVTGKGLSSNDYTTDEKNKLADVEEGAQVNTITGVKGGAESTYRTGNVNITAANIGLGNVNNTSDVNKPVSTAQQAAIDKVLADAKQYADDKDAILLNNSSTAVDSIMELATAMAENDTVIEALDQAIGTKATKADTLAGYGIADAYTKTQIDETVGTINEEIDGSIKELSVSGKIITYTKNDGTTDTITTQDTTYSAATSSVLGLVKSGGDVTISSSGVITVNDDSHNHIISNVDGLQEALDSKASSTHSHTITAGASDDDVVVLKGTNGTNGVSYEASHANSGVTAGTYKSVTVNAKGHVTAGSNPNTLSGYGITDAYTKTQIDGYELITVDDIDTICGTTIHMIDEVSF